MYRHFMMHVFWTVHVWVNVSIKCALVCKTHRICFRLIFFRMCVYDKKAYLTSRWWLISIITGSNCMLLGPSKSNFSIFSLIKSFKGYYLWKLENYFVIKNSYKFLLKFSRIDNFIEIKLYSFHCFYEHK